MKPTEIVAPRRFDHLHRDERGYPVISTVGRTEQGPDFGGISERRKLALAAFDWCAICGLPFRGEPRYLPIPADLASDAIVGEAPVHEICAVYAAQVCPHLSSPRARHGDEVRRGRERERVIEFTGFTRIAAVEAHPSPLQPGIRTLVYTGAKPVGGFSYATPDELADHYNQLLAREEPIAVSGTELKLIRMFSRVSNKYEVEPGGVITGAAVAIGAAFLPRVFDVQGLDRFRGLEEIARLLLNEPQLENFVREGGDVAVRLACQWLLERAGGPPALLAEWRRNGQALLQPAGSRRRRT